MKVFFAESAVGDLQDIVRYYEQQLVPQVGEKFVADIIDHVQTQSDHPEIGRVVPEFDAQNIRELIHPPFRIVYVSEESSIYVARVWRSERMLVLPENNK